MGREAHRAKASQRAWRACTARLEDNLRMFAAYGAEEKRLFEKEWLRLKRIVQVGPARQYRQAKIPMATV